MEKQAAKAVGTSMWQKGFSAGGMKGAGRRNRSSDVEEVSWRRALEKRNWEEGPDKSTPERGQGIWKKGVRRRDLEKKTGTRKVQHWYSPVKTRWIGSALRKILAAPQDAQPALAIPR